MGTLAEPLKYDAKIKPRLAQLYAHNTQTHFTQNLDAASMNRVNGPIGRMMDALAGAGVSTGSYSIAAAAAKVLRPMETDPFDVLDTRGAPRLRAKHESLVSDVDLLLGQASRSPFGNNTWSSSVTGTLNRAAVLNEALDTVKLADRAEFRGVGNSIGAQLAQVARLIRANQQVFHNEREADYVEMGGSDVHSDERDRMKQLMTAVDNVLEDFEKEMKLQGLWENITIVQASEFGRTVTSNGDGSDHAWGGNYWMAGGAVKGGQILGDYPSIGEESDVNLGRGRLLPTTSWERLLNGAGGWFGVPDSAMDTVLPGCRYFKGSLFSHDDLFVARNNERSPTLITLA